MPVGTSRVAAVREAELYAPVKALLEAQGYDVKGEVVGCDVVGDRGDEPPVVVELKRAFGLGLVLQGIDRLALTDPVYVAVGEWPRRLAEVRKLCRRVGLGFIVVGRGQAEVLLDPAALRPAQERSTPAAGSSTSTGGGSAIRRSGGSVRRPIMTAYRQEALRCADRLEAGPAAIRDIGRRGDVPHAARILQTNVYGWFERVGRGSTPSRRAAVLRWPRNRVVPTP